MKRAIPRLLAFAAGCLFVAGTAWSSETINYSYDALGRLVTVESQGDVNDGEAVITTYDAIGNRIDQTVTGTSNGPPPAPELSIGNAVAVVEGGQLSFTVTRSGDTTDPVGASYTTEDGTAIAPGDFVAATNQPVIVPAGQTSATILIQTNDDAVLESLETMSVTLSNTTGGASIASGGETGTGNINDNDVAAIVLVSNVSALEGTDLSFTVSLDQAASGTVTVDYATANGSATSGSDYTSASGTLTFTAGQTSKTVAVATTDDSNAESDEDLVLNISNVTGNASIGDGSGTGTITDNDTPTSLYWTVSDATTTEGNGPGRNLSFTITLNDNDRGGGRYRVYYNTADGTAVAGSDYSSNSGSVTLRRGDDQTITVYTTDDSLSEPTETMSMVLYNPESGSWIFDDTGIGTIDDDDAPQPPAISVSDASATEGANLSFTVSLDQVASGTVTVDYATANGGATSSSDYTSASGTLTFTAGQTSKTVTVATIDDSTAESTETMSLNLSNVTGGATIADATGTGTITDDDAPAQLAIGNASVTEGGALSFTVTRSGTTSTAASASYATSNQTAVAPGDYTAKSRTVSFTSGQTSNTVTVTTIDDSTTESSETMKVTLSNPSSGATITTAVGTGTINDNDLSWSSSLTVGNGLGCGGWCGVTGYMAGGFGSMTNTAFSGYTVTGVYTMTYNGGGSVYLTLSGSSPPPDSGWTSITIPRLGTFSRASAGYSTSANTATWIWASTQSATPSSGTVTIQ